MNPRPSTLTPPLNQSCHPLDTTGTLVFRLCVSQTSGGAVLGPRVDCRVRVVEGSVENRSSGKDESEDGKEDGEAKHRGGGYDLKAAWIQKVKGKRQEALTPQ